MRRLLLLCLLSAAGSGCANLYRYQLDDIDGTRGELRPFELRVSEIGVSTKEAAGLAKAFSRSAKANKTIDSIQNVIAAFQFGPRTGLPVYDEKYADVVFELMAKECPSLQMTGLVSIREQRKYPVISGEIVKILGYCIDKRKDSKSG